MNREDIDGRERLRGDPQRLLEVEPDDQLDRRILFALRRVIRAVDVYSRRLVVQHQITGPQLICLGTLVEAGPISVTDLAYRVQLSKSTVVRILDRLESKGLVLRERMRSDRRCVMVTATPAGHELSAKAPYSDQHPLRRALQQLPRDEQARVTQLLERLVDLMDAQSLSTAPLLRVPGLHGAGQTPGVAHEPTPEIRD
jgi:DNA-binding MarR family transcriptional regulator